MDFLGRIRKLDSSLQRGLDNSFARVFGGKVVPNELEECLKQEIEDFVMQDAQGRYLAPNDFRIGVSAKDFANLSSGGPELPGELADRMSRYCRNSGWGMSGAVTVRITQVDSLHTGQLKTASQFTDNPRDESCFLDADGNALVPDAGTRERDDANRTGGAPDSPQAPAAGGRAASAGGPAAFGRPDQQYRPDWPGDGGPARPEGQADPFGEPELAGRPSGADAFADSRPDDSRDDRGDRDDRDDLGGRGQGGEPDAPAAASRETESSHRSPADGRDAGAAGFGAGAAAGGFGAAAAGFGPAAGTGAGSGSGPDSGVATGIPSAYGDGFTGRADQPVQVPPGPAAPSERERTVTLLLQDGSSRTYEIRRGSNIIGRGTMSDFRLPDTGVSRQHAEITWDGRDAVLVDLHSTNGTMVNDSPIENWLLADGDVISMGHSVMEVRIS